jgi:tetratricopeptide (TPR) repeat protein
VLRQSPFDAEALELHRWTDLAKVYNSAGRDPESLAAFEHAGALLSSLGRDDTGTAVSMFNNWAVQLDQMGRPLEAEKMYRRAIELSRAGRTEETVSPVVLCNYARTLRQLDRLNEAADVAEHAYAKAKRVGHQLAVNQLLLERARIYTARRDPVHASAMLAEVEPRLRRSLPPGHYAFATLASAQALNALAKGDVPAAMMLADQSVSLDEATMKAGGEGGYYLPTLLLCRSAVMLEGKHPGQAAADASRALDLVQVGAVRGTFSSLQGNAYLALGRALQAQGKREEARDAFRSAAENLEHAVGRNHPDTQRAWEMSGL